MIEDFLSQKQKRKKKRRNYIAGVTAFIVAYLFLFGIGWFIFSSPVFRVDHMVVEGNTNVSSTDVITLMQASALQNHSFLKALFGYRSIFIWPSTIGTSDLAFIPQLAAVSISRDYFSHTVRANVTERTPFATWCLMPQLDANGNPISDEQCYWFDDTGTVFERAFDTQGGLAFAIHDYSQSSLTLDGEILPAPFVPNMISIINTITASGIDVNEIALNDISLQQIDVTTYNGPTLHFSLRFSSAEDLPVLESLMAKPGFDKLQYVDFTVQNRAYYK